MYDDARLLEIYCDKFKSNSGPRGHIVFQEGLNTVLGGDAANNSIGKSTFLLVIDYCFGGTTYGEDETKNFVGDHTICFAFKFRDGNHYFSRTVSDSNHVQICDEKYEPTGEVVDLKKFNQMLMSGYEMDISDASFRDVTGRFLRVAGKKNDTIVNPLHYGSPSAESAIESLEKLFDVYKYVGTLKEKLKTIKDKKKTYTHARTLKLVPNAIKTEKQFKNNAARIEELQKELDTLAQDTDAELLDEEMQRRDSAAEARSQLQILKRQYSHLASQYSIVTKHKDDGFVTTESNLQRLAQFFPGADIRRIDEIETFHRKLKSILDSEMSEEAESLQTLMRDATIEIQKLEQKMAELGTPIQMPTPFLERYSEIQHQISGLQSQNEAYETNTKFKIELAETEEELGKSEVQVLRDIESRLNAQMVRFNDFIYEVPREAPAIRFESKSKYDFHTPRDGGTGTAYKSLIVLDLSVLELTQLPTVIHDSSIFKNIGDEPIDKIMELYQKSKKQIFIAFDKAQAYTKRTAQIVNETAVIHLGEHGDELFGWNWGTKNKSE